MLFAPKSVTSDITLGNVRSLTNRRFVSQDFEVRKCQFNKSTILKSAMSRFVRSGVKLTSPSNTTEGSVSDVSGAKPLLIPL